ncbi:MAG: TonB-dependent receptor [Pseudomonadota bacterium]
MKVRKLSVLASTIAGLSLLSTSHVAIAQQDTAADTTAVDEIIVVGSHIKRDGFDYSSPVEIIDSAVLDQTGTTNLGDLLQTLPQNIASINNANSAFTVSSSGLNLTSLRNLGTARTLVLINGRRFVSGVSPSVGYGVDLNAIPVSMIERIEVLTGGASAVYGSDAIAGVVNIVLRTDFEGVMIDGQVGASMESDKNKEDIYITLGGELGDGGNAWMSIGYSNDDPLFARDRAFSDTDLAVYDLDGDGFGETDDWLGSSFPPAGRFGGFLGDGTPFRSGLADRENSDRFNRADFRTIYSPVERRFAYGALTYPISPRAEVFGELNYSIVESESELEPFALDLNSNIWFTQRGGTGGLDVATHPLVPQLLRDNLLAAGITNLNQLGVNATARRLVEFGERFSGYQRTTLRGVVGMNFDLPNNWTLSTHYTYGKTDQDIEATGQINVERAALALDVEQLPDGTIQCVNEQARLQGCVPFNPFGAGTIDAAQVAYLSLPTTRQGIVEQEVFNVTLAGDTNWDLPGGTVAFAFGGEYREERGADIPGDSVQRGITAGNASGPTDGSFDVTEFFGEVILPLHDKLSIDGAVRVGDYSSVGNQTTWKVGVDFAVVEGLRLRTTAATSVRAPNVADLFSGAGETFRNIQDPCDGITATTTGNAAVNCRTIPVIADRIANTGSFTLTQVERQSTGGFTSGNPNVGEETADSLTAGLVWQPNNLDGFSLSIDWYDIEIDDGIATTPRTVVLQRCFDVDPGSFDATCAGRARRDFTPGAGALVEVDSASSNENRFETSGIDVQLQYTFDIGPGTASAGLFYNHLMEFDTIGIVDGSVDDDAGEVLFPEHRTVINLGYSMDDWHFSWRSRVWDRVKDSNTPLLTNENSDVFGNPLAPSKNEIPTFVYHDASVGYNMDRFSVRAGINNVFDKQPPLLTQISQYGNTGTNIAAEAYDPIGRAWYVSFTYRSQ